MEEEEGICIYSIPLDYCLTADQKKEYSKIVKMGIKLQKEGEYEQAIKCFIKAQEIKVFLYQIFTF